MTASLLLAVLVFVGVYDLAENLRQSRNTAHQLKIPGEQKTEEARYPTWLLLFGILFPKYFDKKEILSRHNIVDLIRRSGYYPYATPGEYYAALLSSFSMGILVASAGSGLLALVGAAPLAVPFAMLVLFWAYRRPRTRIREAIRKRTLFMRQNMLLGLSQLSVYLESGVGVQEALRRTSLLGGPFCNLLAFLVARMEVEDIRTALQRVRQHVPDPSDTNMRLFLNDLEGYFLRQRPLAPAIRALRDAVRRDIRNLTLERAATVKRRAVIYGVFAIIGLLISGVAPAFVR